MNLFSSIFAEVRGAFNPTAPQIGCLLPPPKVRAAAPKQVKPADIYAIDEDRNEFGFNFATAKIQNDGARPELTAFDYEELKARDLWGQEKTARGKQNKKGIKTNADNARAKAAWYTGASAAEIAKATGLGDSWAEKRNAAFEAALCRESEETK